MYECVYFMAFIFQYHIWEIDFVKIFKLPVRNCINNYAAYW